MTAALLGALVVSVGVLLLVVGNQHRQHRELEQKVQTLASNVIVLAGGLKQLADAAARLAAKNDELAEFVARETVLRKDVQ